MLAGHFTNAMLLTIGGALIPAIHFASVAPPDVATPLLPYVAGIFVGYGVGGTLYISGWYVNYLYFIKE